MRRLFWMNELTILINSPQSTICMTSSVNFSIWILALLPIPSPIPPSIHPSSILSAPKMLFTNTSNPIFSIYLSIIIYHYMVYYSPLAIPYFACPHNVLSFLYHPLPSNYPPIPYSLPSLPLGAAPAVCTVGGRSRWTSTWQCSCPPCWTRPVLSRWRHSSYPPGTWRSSAPTHRQRWATVKCWTNYTWSPTSRHPHALWRGQEMHAHPLKHLSRATRELSHTR